MNIFTEPFIGEIVSYLGFCGSRYHLRCANSQVYALVNPVAEVDCAQFATALDYKLVNPRFIKCFPEKGGKLEIAIDKLLRCRESVLRFHKKYLWELLPKDLEVNCEALDALKGIAWRDGDSKILGGLSARLTDLDFRLMSLEEDPDFWFGEFVSGFDALEALNDRIEADDHEGITGEILAPLEHSEIAWAVRQCTRLKAFQSREKICRAANIDDILNVEGIYAAISESGDLEALQSALTLKAPGTEEFQTLWISAVEHSNKDGLEIIQKFAEGRLDLEKIAFRICSRLDWFLHLDRLRKDETVLFWLIDQLGDSIDEIEEHGYSVLENLGMGGLLKAYTYAESKGARNVRIRNILIRMETVEQVEFFSKKVDFRNYHIRDLSEKNFQVFEACIYAGAKVNRRFPQPTCFETFFRFANAGSAQIGIDRTIKLLEFILEQDPSQATGSSELMKNPSHFGDCERVEFDPPLGVPRSQARVQFFQEMLSVLPKFLARPLSH
jgi:hypothetical protein